jgi:hypothetical protein
MACSAAQSTPCWPHLMQPAGVASSRRLLPRIAGTRGGFGPPLAGAGHVVAPDHSSGVWGPAHVASPDHSCGGRSGGLAGGSGPPSPEVRSAYVEVRDLLRRILARSLSETRGVTGPSPGSRSGAFGPLGGSPECFPTETRGATGPFPKEGVGPGPSAC